MSTSHTMNTRSKSAIMFTIRWDRTWESSRSTLLLLPSPVRTTLWLTGCQGKGTRNHCSHIPPAPAPNPSPEQPEEETHCPVPGEGKGGQEFWSRRRGGPSGNPRGHGVCCQVSSFKGSGCAIFSSGLWPPNSLPSLGHSI